MKDDSARSDMFSSSRSRKRHELKIEAKDKSESVSDIINIPINEIKSPEFHDRTSIKKENLEKLINNIRDNGLISPIAVRRLKDGTYERVVGFRRLEAVKKLGWANIPAKVLELEDVAAALLTLSENIHREELNPYDEVVSILKFIGLSLDKKEKELTKALYKYRNIKNGSSNKKDEETMVLVAEISELLKKIGKYNLGGFTHKLNILNLEANVTRAIKHKGLLYSYAVEINKIKDESEREKFIDASFKNNVSLVELKKLIKEHLHVPKEEEEEKNEIGSIVSLVKKWEKKKISSEKIKALNEEKQKRVRILFEELQSIFNF